MFKLNHAATCIRTHTGYVCNLFQEHLFLASLNIVSAKQSITVQ